MGQHNRRSGTSRQRQASELQGYVAIALDKQEVTML